MKQMNSFQLAFLSKKSRLKNPVPVKDVVKRTSLKQRFCEYCGDEIHKGEQYFSYKPIFEKRKDRCLKHSPKVYNDISEVEIQNNLLYVNGY